MRFPGRKAVWCGLALAAALAASAGVAAAAPGESAVAAIRRGNDKLRELLAQKADTEAERERIAEQISRELRGLFDIDFLAQRALVDHWAKMTAKQRKDVQAALRAIIEKNYLSQLRGNLNYRTEYLGQEDKGEDVLVKTVILAEKAGRPTRISVDYRLRPEGNAWRVYDVITEDVSVLQNYRAQFNRIIAKEGVDGLIARMHARLKKGGAAPEVKSAE
ncbi:MAG TPA: ABC transporter substrate-binding protein [Myxococcales bacterium]